MDVQRMNNAAITLAILPADIVRILLQIMGLPIESLRLISPSWNNLVLEYLSVRDNLPPLRKVYFERLAQSNVAVVSAAWAPENDAHFLTYFRGWREDAQFGGYSSPPLNLVANYLRWSFPCNCVPIGPSVEANRHGLRLAFSRCSSIEKLGMDTPSARMMASFGRILRNVSVAKLSLRQFVLLEVDEITKLARSIKIDILAIITDDLAIMRNKEHLRAFFRDIIHTGVRQLEIWESKDKVFWIFGKDREYWDNMVAWLSCDEFTVQVVEVNAAGNGRKVQRLLVVPS
ncbi:hypothetical protein PRIPAC_86517 [Pristionchus pacificus]|uniref:Uncharacterized protein n=1 Tax=Pristionchus pacificus TaxID=54126 RepID=A0A2A6BS67_PRIPA|nr:hypothetical protein PRIPAC_86517 [Pristionchus pacificus]|eukprot:PDM68728.1 hypothetical protein PRIPAC_47030 [Pristionchus pacificus]